MDRPKQRTLVVHSKEMLKELNDSGLRDQIIASYDRVILPKEYEQIFSEHINPEFRTKYDPQSAFDKEPDKWLKQRYHDDREMHNEFDGVIDRMVDYVKYQDVPNEEKLSKVRHKYEDNLDMELDSFASTNDLKYVPKDAAELEDLYVLGLARSGNLGSGPTLIGIPANQDSIDIVGHNSNTRFRTDVQDFIETFMREQEMGREEQQRVLQKMERARDRREDGNKAWGQVKKGAKKVFGGIEDEWGSKIKEQQKRERKGKSKELTR